LRATISSTNLFEPVSLDLEAVEDIGDRVVEEARVVV
jgi:hypothetical protein